jgi:hypothetical protein
MESSSKEKLRRNIINRILNCSTEYSMVNLEKLATEELFVIQYSTFIQQLKKVGGASKLKQTY